MLVLCLFDITCNKRRRKANKLLAGYGERVQCSVYECQISHKQLILIQKRMGAMVQDGDRLHYYPLCGKDIGERKADGAALVNWPKGFYIT
jgi:CRISPR-associated protein Cas2